MRLSQSYAPANKYINQFPKEKTALLARYVMEKKKLGMGYLICQLPEICRVRIRIVCGCAGDPYPV